MTADYWNNDYFDDHYYHIEELVQSEGYSTDFLSEAGRHFIREQVAALIACLRSVDESSEAP